MLNEIKPNSWESKLSAETKTKAVVGFLKMWGIILVIIYAIGTIMHFVNGPSAPRPPSGPGYWGPFEFPLWLALIFSLIFTVPASFLLTAVIKSIGAILKHAAKRGLNEEAPEIKEIIDSNQTPTI